MLTIDFNDCNVNVRVVCDTYNFNYSKMSVKQTKFYLLSAIFYDATSVGTLWCSLLKHSATNRNVACSIPDGVIGIFH